MIKKTVTLLLCIGATILVVGGVSYYYFTKDASELCSKLAPNETLDGVRRAAELAGYKLYERERADGQLDIVIPTQDSPFFRFACIATLKDGVLIRKEVVAAD